MFGLKKSKVKSNDYVIFDIPNQENFKIAISKDGDYTCIAVKCSNDVWYRLGDKMHLSPDYLKDVGLTSYRGSDVIETQNFIDKFLELFKNNS